MGVGMRRGLGGGGGIPAWGEAYPHFAAKGLPASVVFMLTIVMSALTLGSQAPPHLSGLTSGSRALRAQKYSEIKITECHSRDQPRFQPL